ncbi:hypothetical protein BDQ12DRAFT_609443 [Crucibulum laeve]|uniref:PARP catalytic domain-containing protein n=1 Tax=Crucibulum laeve TaxID=68775 RepID=A0A5C3LWC8_9AGAR|nr:hypothetical protein BDQ12DRAFT_609443 [Crucibulum laeve]
MFIDEFSFDHPNNQGSGKWNRLVPLAQSEPAFSLLEKQFLKGWKHPKKTKPQVRAIFKILSSEASLKPYHQYRSNPANEQLLFHGTNRCCMLAEDGTRIRLCSLSECFLCGVIRNSFDIRKCGTKNKFRRFGTGIYTTSCSSSKLYSIFDVEADDYALNIERSSRLRVLLVNRVVVGKPYKRRQNAVNLTEPPCGHHSVLGEPGVDLNYEETVVYDNDAIRPAYLIVYGDGVPELHSKMHSLLMALFKTPVAS